MAYKIMIDAGHGGYDGGASYNGRLEKDDTLTLALAVGEILSGMGYDVEYTRTTDVYDSPVQKARIGNASGADLFVSIHRNSSPNPNTFNGVQTLVYSDTGIRADLARSINNQLEQVGYRNINVVERPNLAVLRRTQMPAVLVETGFINSDIDNNLFDTRFDQTAMAIARGIDNVIKDAGLAGNIESKAVPVINGNVNDNNNNRDANGNNRNTNGNSVNVNENLNIPGDNSNYESIEDAELQSIDADEGNVEDNENDIDDAQNYNGYIKDVPSGIDSEDDKYQLLVGIFRSAGSANYQMNSLINQGYTAMVFEDEGLYQVRVGNFDTIDEALIESRELRDRGYETLVVKSLYD